MTFHAYMGAMTASHTAFHGLPGSSRLLRVIDLETTGNSFSDGGVVEIGWQDLVEADGIWRLHRGPQARLVRPGNPISPATSAIHHLIDEDVAGAPLWHEVAPPVLQGDIRPAALAAHRSAFEQRWCVPAVSGNARWICTYKCALRIWPEAPGHSNQGLRYWRRPEGLDRALGLPAHRAGPDAYVTAHHLRDMLALAPVEQLLAWSAEPALLVRVPYGPYRYRSWRDLDRDVLAQIAAGDGNADMAFTARTEIARRGEQPVAVQDRRTSAPSGPQMALGLDTPSA
ncbi:exonuclease domain-containing protein [Lichenicoccus sp.]|uniref:exonuclease domain-containing protein n=1 Tax=Lichenicoccus sp. TaxID=2781899 RepID=UPI003D1260F4